MTGTTGATPTTAILSGNGSGNTITIGSGGVIVNGGTGSYPFSGGITASGAVDLGSSALGNSSGSFLTVAAGTPDLVLNVAGSYSNPNSPNAANNGLLQIAGVIKDSPNPSGTFTGTTTTGSNTVTLTAGTTAQLYPGVTVTGLTGLAGTQTITSIIDSTHFTVGSNATVGGSATPAFVSHTGITKNGGGLLDFSQGNSINSASATQQTFTNTGPLTINGGVVIVARTRNSARFRQRTPRTRSSSMAVISEWSRRSPLAACAACSWVRKAGKSATSAATRPTCRASK